ncbi:tRNA preQ1(34) S-adenosylmethionine ribosyltransferase-isomerase QueA [Candidatus Poribacteria bacterium]|nr:tRNA preQ1(34) S-adenosylmethionine ribosyltransferase-isomerase QueA [Candidatus Poribacteria bacterium]
MKTSLFDYHLPEELIAQYPLNQRDESRLMVLNRANESIKHRRFSDLPEFLTSSDLLVVNNTKVIPARLMGKRAGSGGSYEVLLLKPKGNDIWEGLVKRSSRLKPGTRLIFGDGRLEAEVLGKTDTGGRLLKFSYNENFNKILDDLGKPPLPPYIRRNAEEEDKKRYQTVYASQNGAVAAPTAGLHFTPTLLKKLASKGIEKVELTLHVGLGTFQPVRSEDVEEHHIHSEEYEITNEAAEKINEAKNRGGKIIAVGTTSVRTLESSVDSHGKTLPGSGITDIFIYPGYKFRIVDVLITNFHLPRSTLIMLVSAFASRDFILKAYEEAVKTKYRFYSYGDAMLIL